MLKQSRRLAVFLICCLLLCGAADAAQAEPGIKAKSALLVDNRNGTTLYAKHPDMQRAPASTTKIMTALLAIENSSLQNEVIVSKKAAKQTGSRMGLRPKERLNIGELLYGLLLPSGNDAAMAIAEGISGNERDFVALMNKKAAALGMAHTHYVNPSGLPVPGHYSTAADLTRLARYGLNHAAMLKVTSTPARKVSSHYLTNRNQLLTVYPGMVGVKTGHTDAAGYCLVFAATKGDRELVGTVLGSTKQAVWHDAAALLDYGFRTYTEISFVNYGQKFGSVKVKDGKQSAVPVIAAQRLCYTLPAGRQGEYRVVADLPAAVTAPVRQGMTVGKLCLLHHGKQVAETKLVAAHSVAKAGLLDWLRHL